MKTQDARHYDIIVAPVVTEKATVASEHNKVVFKVASKATKPQIKEAIEKLFDFSGISHGMAVAVGKGNDRYRLIDLDNGGEEISTKEAVADVVPFGQ